MERTSFISRNSKFYNTMTTLRSWSLKNSPPWNLTQIDMIQIDWKVKKKLDFFFNLF